MEQNPQRKDERTVDDIVRELQKLCELMKQLEKSDHDFTPSELDD